ncbi:prenyltransferase and squalene oxidase repeat protein [Geobacter sp. OR-1]|uniref:prenyltransferase/squalene oxidase repeat-containing protein n=1 Tax=Geobacter sp. OR-1 TaxID=1266765 RepID=UPI000543C6A4|nr:prenyltransferase/squalene oxidase repeat-containing protein [Geobacter sp. OR-1]GAM10014.1 prenyltransferase and squalene oxidase repeat protein [Geobacter sp. OR-1]
MKKLCIAMTSVLMFALPLSSMAAEKVVAKTKPDLSLKLELENAIGKGLTWLAAKQQPTGNWAQPEYPALTALALTAFQGDPSKFYKSKYEQNIKSGYDYLVKSAKPDGGIYGKDLANYNTSISMMALLVANNSAYEPLLKKGRKFLVGLQDDFGEKGMGDDPLDGGIGYGGSYKHSDLANTTFALEALYYTRFLKSDVANDPDAKDLNWKAAIQFISRTQNLPGSNDQKWASDDPANKGGFVYFPADSKAGEQKIEGDKTALRSYGSMSYAGLLSFIYAQVDKNDPRVKAVIDWLSKNYTLAENPGMGQDGLYYYFHTMAKALSAAGVDTLTTKDGKKINWRQDLARKLLDLQREDGSWVNQNGRWWERDPNLVTSYATITLEILHRGL